ncbi:MFS transporter [Streptomyces sp. NPDC051776]|uniref:MFS transporter n=1 Tax=Streptomyces sp. NPDC051776 TaxID=3155414 RepID=UPI00342BC923
MSTVRRVFGGALFHVPHPHDSAAWLRDTHPHPRLLPATLVSGTGLFMLGVNTTGINTALRGMAEDLGMGTVALGWAVGVYMLTVAAMVVPGGRLGDILGQRVTIVTGSVVFAGGAVVVASADSELLLILGRILQGVGAAALMPSTMAVLRIVWPRERQGVALGLWGAVAGLAFAVGPLIGGAFTDGPSWRWLWWASALWALSVALLAGLALPGLPHGRKEHAVDVSGTLLLAFSLGALLVGLQQIPAWGLTSPATLTALSVAVGGLAMLVRVESRSAAPVLHLRLLKKPPLVAACLGTAVNTLFLIGFLYFFNLYAQSPETLAFSAVTASVALLPYGACVFAVSMAIGSLCDHVGYRWPVAAGIALTGAGSLWLSKVGAHSGYDAIWPGTLVLGVGVGTTLSAPSAAGLGALAGTHAGEASGIINVARYVTAALVVSVGTLGFLAAGSERLNSSLDEAGTPRPGNTAVDQLLSGASRPAEHLLDEPHGQALRQATADALSHGFASVMFWLGVLALIATPLWLVLMGPSRGRRPH